MQFPQTRRVLLHSRDSECKALLLGASWPESIEVKATSLFSSSQDPSQDLDERQLASCNCLIVHEDLGVVGKLRSEGFTHPILCLVSKDDVQSRIEALEAGADDCLGSVFSLAEFIARTEALCRRQTKTNWRPAEEEYGFEFCAESGTLSCDGRAAALTQTEARMLTVFLENLGRVLAAQEMGERVWGAGSGVSQNLICVHVRNLRSKLKSVLEFDPIRTVRGRGYQMPPGGSPSTIDLRKTTLSGLNSADVRATNRRVGIPRIEGNCSP